MAAEQIRLLVIEDVPEVAQYMRTALAAQNQITILEIVGSGERAMGAIEKQSPDVVVVDALLRGSVRPIAILARLKELGIPGIVITVPQTKVPNDPERGIAAVITMPFVGHELISAIRGAHDAVKKVEARGTGRIVAVYGPKGGVGCSTISLNLAAALVAAGRRVILVDGCFQFGDLRILLRMPDAPSILDLPTDELVGEDLESVVQRHPAGFGVLLGPPRIEQAEMVSARDVEKLVTILRKSADVVVVDLPVALNETTLAFLDAADSVLLLVVDERASLANGAAALETFRTLGYPAHKVRVVVNRAAPGDPPSDLVAALGVEVDHIVTEDAELAERAASMGAPFVVIDGGAKASLDVTTLALSVAGAARARTAAAAG